MNTLKKQIPNHLLQECLTLLSDWSFDVKIEKEGDFWTTISVTSDSDTTLDRFDHIVDTLFED